MNWAWEQASQSNDPIAFLREFVFSRDFLRECMKVAGSMVTAVQTDQGRTWRQAAAKGTRGRSIYLTLRQGLTPQMRLAMERQMTENAALISRTPLDVAQYVVNEIREKAFEGLRASAITDLLLESFPLASQNRINTIARTETSKASTMLTMAQSEDLGIQWYQWRTSEDSRVRSSHSHMDDVLVRWSTPPSPEKLIGERSVGKYHAGNIYNCRCYPEPVIDWEYVNWPHRVYMDGTIRRMTKTQFMRMVA
jgi:SPP1 gp7 family putative phage head morphogenesis protein